MVSFNLDNWEPIYCQGCGKHAVGPQQLVVSIDDRVYCAGIGRNGRICREVEIYRISDEAAMDIEDGEEMFSEPMSVAGVRREIREGRDIEREPVYDLPVKVFSR